MFLVGMSWSIAFPIMTIKFLFQSKIVIGESVASLTTLLYPANPNSTADIFCSTLILVTVVIVPVLAVTLSTIVQCCDKNRTSPILYGFAKFTSLVADWSLVDVFAVALLTSLFAFASFSILRASAPWGFYCVLMAAMSAYEVIKAVQTSFMDAPGSSAGYVAVSAGGIEMTSMPEAIEGGDDSDTSVVHNDELGDAESQSRIKRRHGGKDYSPVDGIHEGVAPHENPIILKSTIVSVIVTIFRRLGLPFFILKALGWGIFFFIWFINSSGGSLDLESLSSTLRSNIPFVSSSIQSAVPYGVGMCKDLFSSENVTGQTTDNNTCIDKPYLHYEKHTTYEVLARWMSGFKNVTVTDMYLSIPSEKTFSLTVNGRFDTIKLSLFLGQCLGKFFSTQESNTTQLPVCSGVFDRVHSWNNVTWSIEVDAVCSQTQPFVRDIKVDQVRLGNELKIEEEIAFGIKIPLDSMSAEFTNGIRESIQPLLIQKRGWIPWGPRMYDLPGLLSHLVELNNNGDQFVCPAPTNR
jgi:hypothetical protein